MLTACGKTHAAFGRRCIPTEPLRFAPFFVAFRSKYTRASSPGGGSSLTRLVGRAPHRPRRSREFHHRLLTACGKTHAAQFSRWGLDRRCIPAEPRRFAALCVAFRSKYTRASSPGGGSSLTRLVSRAPRPHRENWPLSALTRVSPQAVSASLRSGEVGSEWARNPPIRAVPWRETGSSRRLPLPVAHLAPAEVAPAAFGAETGCLNGLLEEPACRKRCGRRRFGRPSIQEPAMEGDFRLPRLRVDPVRTRRPPFSAFLGEWPALRASGGSPPRRP